MAQSFGPQPFKYKPYPYLKNYRLWKCNCCDAGAIAFVFNFLLFRVIYYNNVKQWECHLHV